MAQAPLLSIVIPAFNEVENFKNNKLDQVHQFLDKQPYNWEVIVVDDGSSDETAELIKAWIKDKPHWKLIKNPHYGKSKTVATGMLNSKGQIRLFTDFDQATPITAVKQVIDQFNQGCEVVIGSRQLSGAKRHQEPPLRHIMGRVFNLFVQIIAVRGISDTQCGFKAFSASATKDLFNRLVVYKNRRSADAYTGAFDVELLFLARKRRYKICQIPVSWKYVNTSRVSPLKDSLRMMIDIIKIRWAYLTGRYS